MTLVGSAIAHTAMVYGDGALWLWGYGASGGPGTGRDEVVQIPPSTGAVLRAVTGARGIGGIQPSMVVADGGLWLAGGAGGSGPQVEACASQPDELAPSRA